MSMIRGSGCSGFKTSSHFTNVKGRTGDMGVYSCPGSATERRITLQLSCHHIESNSSGVIGKPS
ncbi:hypothetical protein BDV97DRAFT_346238 [Delphinella strobiligena]|nr:hypothetical protein BDV97DRAFT_346238 [Delphinella strobiligena]